MGARAIAELEDVAGCRFEGYLCKAAVALAVRRRNFLYVLARLQIDVVDGAVLINSKDIELDRWTGGVSRGSD